MSCTVWLSNTICTQRSRLWTPNIGSSIGALVHSREMGHWFIKYKCGKLLIKKKKNHKCVTELINMKKLKCISGPIYLFWQGYVVKKAGVIPPETNLNHL